MRSAGSGSGKLAADSAMLAMKRRFARGIVPRYAVAASFLPPLTCALEGSETIVL